MDYKSKIRINLKYEDTIQCFFFFTKNYSEPELHKLCDSINKSITSLSQDYIWHRDEFKVVLPITAEENKGDIKNHLMSITCFGDNVEDEWFIVYILLEITKKYPDLIIQIEDNDGDFLLIEAADYLPSWANPDSTENRVFIYEHSIHIIPPSISAINSNLKLNEALSLVAQKSVETKASKEIQEAIFKRIGNYPQKINENCHKAIIKLPLEVAAVLTLKPSVISSLVSAFCSLDTLDAKHCRDISSDDCFNVEVKFTKFLYAQLTHTRFPNGFRYKISNKKNDNKALLGLKLICAYKAIMANSPSDIYSSKEFNTFINSLTKNGYFKDNLQGSVEYNRLLANAKSYFSNLECPVSRYVCNVVNDVKLTDEFRNMIEYLKNKSIEGLLEEDDDSWLNVNPDELNEFLNKHYGKNKQVKNNDPITPHIINSELNNFLKETSDYEGVEEINDGDTEGTIEFDSENFVNCLEKMLNIISNKDVSEESDQSDFYDDDDSSSAANNFNSEQDQELATKLKTINEGNESEESAVLNNLIRSMREEGLSGPASTVFRTIGIPKCDLIDSDDED